MNLLSLKINPYKSKTTERLINFKWTKRRKEKKKKKKDKMLNATKQRVECVWLILYSIAIEITDVVLTQKKKKKLQMLRSRGNSKRGKPVGLGMSLFK